MIERVALAVATGAALAAHLVVHFTPSGLSWVLAAGLAWFLALPSLRYGWDHPPEGLRRTATRSLRAALVLTGALAVLYRLVPVLAEDTGQTLGAIIGTILSALALLFLYGRGVALRPSTGGGVWRHESELVPAVIGLLVATGLHYPGWRFFIPLCSVSGAALWVYAVVSGGPRRVRPALGLLALVGSALAAATILALPRMQPRVMELVARAYAEPRTGLSDRTSLGDVEELVQSTRIVARVWCERPPLRLRMQVFRRFDGRSWAVGPARERPLEPSAEGAHLGTLLRRVPGSTFELEPPPGDLSQAREMRVLSRLGFDDGWGLLVPARTLLLRAPTAQIKVDTLGRVFVEGGPPRLYGTLSRDGGSKLAEPPTEDDRCALAPRPSWLDDRLVRLARDLAAGTTSEAERLERTTAHLLSPEYVYTLKPGRSSSGNPLVEFLFEKKRGYCEHFATAAAVLLRLRGIPTRYVKGVRVRPEHRVAGHYVVRESDAHAWVEAWTSERGWIEVDPTPPAREGHGPGLGTRLWENLESRLALAWAEFRQETWPQFTARVALLAASVRAVLRRHPIEAAAGVLAALVAGAALRWGRPLLRGLLRRGASHEPAAHEAVPPGLRELVDHLERTWVRCGRPRSPGRGLREHLEGLPDEALSPRGRALGARVIDCYYGALFGGRQPGPGELESLTREAIDALPRGGKRRRPAEG